ncbi:hypothetical protein COLO4_05330 [Corchorus olitorius]|uniref:Uncharacterized protein n=1 Tax=Corchorus olitorius TaxID=93759 RepID=A0A1R3KR73_9ROSI|nr:hypothetical protein COLO4_05330 [Corchorus olitorius]
MAQAFEAQTMEVPPAEGLQPSGFCSATSPLSIYRFNSRFKLWRISIWKG